MPLEIANDFSPPWYLRGSQRQTILVNVLRNPSFLQPERERIYTADGDFHEIDWYRQGSKKCIIVSHGLEGDSRRQYTRGLIKCLYSAGWDGIGFNFRSCGGEINKLPRSYHCGDTGDLRALVDRLVEEKKYDTIVLAGFSLGGNVSLLLAGKAGKALPDEVKAVIGVSVPIDLTSSVPEIESRRNWHYMLRFMQGLRAKAFKKIDLGILDESYRIPVAQSNNFTHFDHIYTAPLHGFASGKDYWAKVSSLPYLEQIAVPSLIINSADDTFISELCLPKELARDHPLINLVITAHGGHVGFVQQLPWKRLWSEQRIKTFLLDELSL